jgi:hypothetical protein
MDTFSWFFDAVADGLGFFPGLKRGGGALA